VLFLKIVIVPIFISIVTLAGRKWGHKVAGVLAGFPVVAGPIIVFVALDQGVAFGQQAALAAINGTLALIIFTITFCWACTRFHLAVSILIATAAWFLVAILIQIFPLSLMPAALLSSSVLALTNFLLPKVGKLPPRNAHFNDMPWRMLIGALLTIAITTLAVNLGPMWSGTLAVFPVISLVLAIFVYLGDGSGHVVEMYKGMLTGLYTFIAFFFTLACMWPAASIWEACLMAIPISLLVQLAVQFLIKGKREVKRVNDKRRQAKS